MEGEYPFTCKECSVKFQDIEEAQSHFEQFHLRKNNVNNEMAEEKHNVMNVEVRPCGPIQSKIQ